MKQILSGAETERGRKKIRFQISPFTACRFDRDPDGDRDQRRDRNFWRFPLSVDDDRFLDVSTEMSYAISQKEDDFYGNV